MIAITGHFERGKVRATAEKLFSMLRANGTEAAMLDISSRRLRLRKFDFVCVVGGDGSLLRAARELRHGTALLGIAAGKRGYLMQVKPEQLGKAAEQIAAGKYCIEERARLKGIADGKHLPLALNELLVVPRRSGSLIECLVVAGEKRERISCDGLIVATSTGSSGHAYSAGGMKLEEGGGKFIVVPSNPLNRQGKPFTVPGKKRVIVKCLEAGSHVEVVVDGRERFRLKEKLIVESGRPALLIKVKGL